MTHSIFELERYARYGLPAPSMTPYDRLRAQALFTESKTETLTGIPPIIFRSDGTPLTAWSIYGNGQQTGTPEPDAPIMPEFVGVRTENLIAPIFVFNKSCSYNPDSKGITFPFSTGGNRKTAFIYVEPNTRYTFSSRGSDRLYISEYNTRKTISELNQYDLGNRLFSDNVIVHDTITIPIMKYIFTTSQYTKMISIYYSLDNEASDVMLNLGSTSLHYEPYGYKIPITCGGQTVQIYIGDPLRKALDGSDATDILYSTGIITREVDAEGNALVTPVTQSVDVPEIPTAKGQNLLTVGTDLQPSSVSISGHITGDS